MSCLSTNHANHDAMTPWGCYRSSTQQCPHRWPRPASTGNDGTAYPAPACPRHRRFTLALQGLRTFVNDERTRSFVAIGAAPASHEVGLDGRRLHPSAMAIACHPAADPALTAAADPIVSFYVYNCPLPPCCLDALTAQPIVITTCQVRSAIARVDKAFRLHGLSTYYQVRLGRARGCGCVGLGGTVPGSLVLLDTAL